MGIVSEPTKQTGLYTQHPPDAKRITEQRAALADVTRQAFYNMSRLSLHHLKSRSIHRQLRAKFKEYLNGFSSTVQAIFNNFKLPPAMMAEHRTQLPNKAVLETQLHTPLALGSPTRDANLAALIVRKRNKGRLS